MKGRTLYWKAASLLVIASMLMSAVFVFSASPVSAQTEPPTDPEAVQPVFEDPTEEEVGQAEPETDALMVKAQTEGGVSIIVVLNVPDAPDSAGTHGEGEEPVAVYAAAQTALMRSLAGRNITNVHNYNSFPLVAMRVDAAALRALLRHHMVAAVQEDHKNYTTLTQSTTIVGANEAAVAGFTGAGSTVAIIDTGVQTNHPFLTGKVVDGGCYSGANGHYGSQIQSTCPNGNYSQDGIAGAAACAYTSAGCYHGTHVAGIAAGNNASMTGVARSATILGYNVFSYDTYYDDIGAFDSDILQALDDVYQLRTTYTITSVNMSLGGGKYTKYCDAAGSAMKKAIDKLRSVNIATIISSGNNGFIDGISYPACISTAVSVGATDKYDDVADYSNYDSFLSLLAPGSDIYSSITGSTYEELSGTSMAAPHVTGAWAVLRQAFPTKSVSSILSMLKSTGVPVKDWRNKKTKPRINIAYALGKYTKPTSAPTLLSPGNGATLIDSTPFLVWSTVPLASKYKVTIKRNGTSTAYSKTLKAADICSLGSGVCVLHVPTILKSAMHTWTVQAYSGAGGGPVSVSLSFNTPTSTPTSVTLGEPQGSIVGYNQPTFNWTLGAAPWADKFYFTLYKDGKRVTSKTYEASKVCQESDCSVPAPKTLTTGSYSWEIKPWNPVGYGVVSSATFTVDLGSGYSNSFDSDYRGLTLLYPHASWWWLNSSKLYSWYGNNYTWLSTQLQGTFKDIDMTAVMYRNGDPNYSIGFNIRGVPTLVDSDMDWKTTYQFFYTQSGYFSIWKKYNNKLYNIQPWTETTGVVTLDGYNTVRVRTVGATMYFYINGALLWSGAEHVSGPDLKSGVPGIMSYLADWSDYQDYLYIDSLTTTVPGTTTSEAEETVSAEQLALNEAALANPMGSPYGPKVSMADYEFLLTATDKPVTTIEQKMQACIEAGIEGCPTVLPK